MTVYGYWRCSTDHQDQQRQVLALKEAGCDVITGDKVTGVSDLKTRAELSKLLEEMESGSNLNMSELSRLSRSFIGMINEVSKLLEMNILIVTLDKRLDTRTMPKEITMLLVSILGYAASQELAQLKSRTSEGRAVAKNKGVKFGAKRKYDKYQVAEIMDKRNNGQGYGAIAKALGMNKSTVQMIVQRELAAA